MHTVYRVESVDDGHGPYAYRSGKLHDELCAAHNDITTHPDIDWDTESHFVQGEDCCGFESISLLKAWFKGFLRKLHRANYVLVVYQVDTILKTNSGKQIAFQKEVAIKVKTASLLNCKI